MRSIIIFMLVFTPILVFGQSKSVTRFRSDFKENSNMFFYSSTLKMLNTENNPDFADLLKGIEEIRVLNYNKDQQKFTGEDISGLKKSLEGEDYKNIMMVNDKGNTVSLYSREKHGRTAGFVAVVENPEKLVLIDLIGAIDIKKFMELKQKLDARNGNPSEN